MGWFVYMVRCSDGSLYTGIAKDVRGRVAKHNRGKGAKYTRSRLPVELVYCKFQGSRSSASKEEWKMKRLSRPEKEEYLEIAGSDPRKQYKLCTIVPWTDGISEKISEVLEDLDMPFLTEVRQNCVSSRYENRDGMVIWIDRQANDAKYLVAIQMIRTDTETSVIRDTLNEMGGVTRFYDHPKRKQAVLDQKKDKS